MFKCQALYFLIAVTVFSGCDESVNLNVIEEFPDDLLTIIQVLDYEPSQLPLGKNVTLLCKTKFEDCVIWWTFNDRNCTEHEGYITEKESENINKEQGKKYEVSILHIINVNFSHVGEYTCHAAKKKKDEIDFAKKILNVTSPAKIAFKSEVVKARLHQKAQLYCIVEGYPFETFEWRKESGEISGDRKVTPINQTTMNMTLEIPQLTRNNNGTYICSVNAGYNTANASISVLVLDKPQVTIDFVKPIGRNKLYLNWTVNDGNAPSSLSYTIQYGEDGDSSWVYYTHDIGGGNRSYVLEGVFKPDTNYKLRMQAKNSEGDSQYHTTPNSFRMLPADPEFIPEVKVNGVTPTSITIKWESPSDDLKDYVHTYKLISQAVNSSERLEAVYPTSDENLYMFTDLKPATTYNFQVAACSEFTNSCGNWSEKVNGTTMDGSSGPIVNLTVECEFDSISHTSFVYASWKPPVSPHGTILNYNVVLEGSASFINEQGILENVTWGPKATSVRQDILNQRFHNVSANTNYTVKVSAVTRSKRNGNVVEKGCTMPITTPNKQKLSRLSWEKLQRDQKWMFQMSLPRLSERNGPICCYRIFLVRMEPYQKFTELPPPENLPVVSYDMAHNDLGGGAYVAEMFTSDAFHSKILLGDEEQVFNVTGSSCDECIGLRPYAEKLQSTNSTSNRVLQEEERLDEMGEVKNVLVPYDGELYSSSNYTAFVEVTVRGADPNQILAAYSNYLVMMNPGPDVVAAPLDSGLGIFVQVLCGLVVITLLLLTALCLLHRYTKQAHAQAVEMITFRTSLRHLCRSLRGRQRLVSLNPPDMCPISRSELVAAYIERHRDSDYGFQQEFELLPDRFTDRTTRASDARENVYKNRYPDIKAYDQTRVKLSQVDSIAGSDYINANYVLGYKERKKFICAQGPMDTTVNDFWRMIWEQHLELILMLTNLEEYSKTKCAKYWPEKSEGEKVFGDLTVTYFQETRFSDYIVRELKISKSGSREKEERHIVQYHYLVWKDFMAPEHPHGIIKFIKRMNEAYSIEKGSILVHCSAGVGRTGTLVALDCLLQQLKDEGQVAIFNTICDLRHQRNFLVQSLKQYIFIYRALMEVAQYGDTEILASDLKGTVEKLRYCDKDTMKCKMEEDFENIISAFEDRKSCSVASGEENREKNRSDIVVPYDRNRVILTPLAGKEHSTYINASFIEGYDNSESFIITQDPMDSTIADFWRMVAEQGISVIVMLSELGEGKCPRYWPEDETSYGQISVRYVQAESCPYYTRREMYIKNRDGEDFRVTHLQYHGWPTVDGEVPEVTRGLIELVDHSQSALVQHGFPASMVIHCGIGSDRSSMFVGLSILVQQLRVEKRVDIFTVVRKLRSQRQAMISSYAQYEFLHRAIVNYAELHGLCDA